MHLTRQAIIAAYVGRDIEERLLMKGAIGILSPTILVAFENIQPFHGATSDRSSDIGPYFVHSPAAIRQHTSATDAHITAVFEYVMTVSYRTRHRAHKAFKARAQMFPQMHAQGSANTESGTLGATETSVCTLGRITVPPEQIAGMQHHAAGETLIDSVLLDSLTHLRTHAARKQ